MLFILNFVETITKRVFNSTFNFDRPLEHSYILKYDTPSSNTTLSVQNVNFKIIPIQINLIHGEHLWLGVTLQQTMTFKQDPPEANENENR